MSFYTSFFLILVSRFDQPLLDIQCRVLAYNIWKYYTLTIVTVQTTVNLSYINLYCNR